MRNGEQVRNNEYKRRYALQLAVKKGYIVALITGGSSEAVKNRMNKLGVYDVYLSCHDKVKALNELIHIYDLKTDEILYMGDDLPIISYASCRTSYLPRRCSTRNKNVSQYISNKKGGKGCVRDVIEQTMKLHGKWMNDTSTPSI